MIFKRFRRKRKIGLALGGGATKGTSIFAIIEELEKLNLKISFISGTSVGAIIGAYYALYGEVSTLKAEILSFSKSDWIRFVDFNRMPKKSLIKGKKYKKFLEEKFGDKKFSNTKIPLVISVTNLITGKIEYIEKGKIVDAVIASSAFPGIFPPIKKEGDIYVDGGVLNNLPYEILIEKGLSKIIAINLFNWHKRTKINNLFDVIVSSIELMSEKVFVGLEENNKKLFILTPKFKKSIKSMWDFSDLYEKYDAGKIEFNLKRNKLLRWLKS